MPVFGTGSLALALAASDSDMNLTLVASHSDMNRLAPLGHLHRVTLAVV